MMPPRYALLPDGGTVEIRPARAEDADAVRAMHEDMSPDNAYLRFFSLSSLAPAREAARLCRAPSPDHVALLARRDGRLVGVASYEATGRAGIAEIAFAVADQLHGHGIGTLLLEHLVSIARQRHVTAFAAETLPENIAMQHVLADAGLPVDRHYADGVIELSIPLPAHDDAQLDHYLDVVASRGSRADVASLRHIFRPSSVAVVGAGRRRGTVGREILHNIVAGGYSGQVYAVNPRGRSMEGLRCLPSAADLPAGVDLAVVAVPAAEVPGVAAQCGDRGVRALVVVTSDLGSGGADLLAICRRYGMRLVGPNCFGVVSSAAHLNATFGARTPPGGTAGLVVQSGGVGIAILEHISRLGIGVSAFASVGDKYDVSSNDLLCWWEHDDQTRLAILYVESFGNPRAFARTARRVGRQMPVLTVIGGRSAAGQRAAASHTAAAATPLVTQEALFTQAGVIATESLGELVNAAAYLASQPPPGGRRVGIVSNAGGAGVLAADACGDCELTVAALAPATRRRLSRILPTGAATSGPVDATAAVDAAAYRSALEAVAADPGVDCVLAIGVPTAIADVSAAITSAFIGKPVAAVLLEQAEPVVLTSAATPAAQLAGQGDDPAARIPVYSYPEDALQAIAQAARYREWRDSDDGQLPELDGIDAVGAGQLVSAFLTACPGGGWLAASDVASLLASYRIPFVTGRIARDEDEAAAAATALGGRVVVKAQVDGLVHKSDAGAVKLDLRSEAEVTEAYRSMADAFGDKLEGVLVQPMVCGGVEMIVGVVQEPVFGPLVIAGMGGVATELINDRSARLVPLTDTGARQMLSELRGAPLLNGYRGAPPTDVTALAGVLMRVSRLAEDVPEVAELDLNPVIVQEDRVSVVDARIRIVPAAPRDPFLRQLR